MCAQLALHAAAKELLGASSDILLPLLTDDYVWMWVAIKAPVPSRSVVTSTCGSASSPLLSYCVAASGDGGLIVLLSTSSSLCGVRLCGCLYSGRQTVSKFAAWVKSALIAALQLKYIVHDDVALSDTPFARHYDNVAHCYPLVCKDNSTRLPQAVPEPLSQLLACPNLHQRAQRRHEAREHLRGRVPCWCLCAETAAYESVERMRETERERVRVRAREGE